MNSTPQQQPHHEIDAPDAFETTGAEPVSRHRSLGGTTIDDPHAPLATGRLTSYSSLRTPTATDHVERVETTSVHDAADEPPSEGELR